MAKLIRQAVLGGVIATALFATASAYAACTADDINGSAWPEGSVADRTLFVTPSTKSVNVNYGESVRFVMQDGREVIWQFNGLANDLTLGTLFASPSASEGSSSALGAGASIPVYVEQGNSPLRANSGD